MTAPVSRLTAPLPRPRRAAAWTLLLTVGACLLAAGCSSGGSEMSGAVNGTAAVGGGAAPAAPLPEHAPGMPAGTKATGSSGSGATAGVTAAPLPGGQSVIFTATLSLRATNIQTTVAKATQLAQAAGGYVSGEHASMTPSRHARAMVSIQFKVPAAGFQSTLGALSALGTKRSETQQAQDVTGTVADVNSRVASAEAAIAQLRKLLSHAGTVGGLLTVQEQINQEEASLEALQSQQRALARETSYATISMTVTGPPPPHPHHQPHQGVAGFLGGLAAGWRALRVVVAALLTLAGAVLPFAIPLGLAAWAAVAMRHWLGRRRSAGTRPAD
jgi:uncharacterized protein DUF4349